MKVGLILAFLTSGLTLAGCSSMPAPGGGPTMLTRSSEEPVIKSAPKEFKPSLAARGAELDVNDRRSKEFGLMSIPQLTDYFNRLLDRIKAEAGLPSVPARVYVTVRPTPEHQATADGNIYLSASTVEGFDTEAEVVAMLAHEFGHVAFGHFDVDVVSDLQKQVQSSIEIARKLDEMFGSKGGKALSPSQEQALKRIRNAIELTDKVLIPAFSREQERTADRFAVDITRRLGYPYGSGLKVMLEKLADNEEKELKRIEAEQQKEIAQIVDAGFQNSKGLFDDVKNFAISIAVDTVSKTHYSAEMRLDEAQEYNDRFYPKSPQDNERREEWKKVIESKTVSRTMANYALAREALAKSEEGEHEKAIRLAKKAVEKPTSEHAFPQYALATAYSRKGDLKNAGIALRKSIMAPEPVWEAFHFLSEFERNSGRHDSAAKVLQEGFVRLGSPPNKRPDIIRFHVTLGNKDKVKAMEVECHMVAPRLRENCTSAADVSGMGLHKPSERNKPKKRS